MFGWFRRRREIYSYWDGERTRRADPLELWNRIWTDPECVPQDDLGPATGIGEDGQEVAFDPDAQQRVLAMARRVFGLKPYAEGGLLIDEVLTVLGDYLAYMAALKKKRSPPLTSSPRSASLSSEESTTKPSSDSSSTSPESTSSGDESSLRPLPQE